MNQKINFSIAYENFLIKKKLIMKTSEIITEEIIKEMKDILTKLKDDIQLMKLKAIANQEKIKINHK